MIDDGFEIKFLPGIPPQEAGCPPLSPRTERVDGMIIEYDTAVRMRDGIEIYADVFRPDSPEPVPPIIGWGPYGKHGAVKYDIFPKHGVDPAWTSKYAGFEAPDPLYWTRHGYAVINVDPRGMWNSQGDATFYSSQEARDVYDFIEWAGTQPWSNGKVGMSGVSYLAITQWRAAADHPPHLAAINPWEGVSDRYRDMSYHGGIPEDSFGPMWRSKRVAYSNGKVEDTVAMHADHPLFDAYWESKTPDLSKVEIPAFVVASWSDQGLHNRGTIEGYKHISSKDKWLLIHGRKKWQFYYRPDNVELLRQFFDKFLRGVEDSGVDAWPRVRLEVRERFYVGDYRDEPEWPLAQTEPRPLYLDAEFEAVGGKRSLGRANGSIRWCKRARRVHPSIRGSHRSRRPDEAPPVGRGRGLQRHGPLRRHPEARRAWRDRALLVLELSRGRPRRTRMAARVASRASTRSFRRICSRGIRTRARSCSSRGRSCHSTSRSGRPGRASKPVSSSA